MPLLPTQFLSDNFDYTFSSTPYSFGPTDDNEPIPSLVISIPIVDDMVNEFNETFKLTIEVSVEDRAANVTEGEISMTVVLIKDDDGKTNLIQLSIKYNMYGHQCRSRCIIAYELSQCIFCLW